MTTNDPTIFTGPIETQIDTVHDELTDKMLVSTYNARKKKRLQLDVDREILDAELRSLANHIADRHSCFISNGWADLDDSQPSLFDAAQ